VVRIFESDRARSVSDIASPEWSSRVWIMTRRILTLEWLEAHKDYQHDWCLIWPFATLHGYGQLGPGGKKLYAHRVMCELVKGPPPTDKHQAAHECGNGDQGCVNPRHLSWKTLSENQLDCRRHGTHVKNPHGNHGRLSHEKAARIRSLKGVELQKDVAEAFGVSESTISDIWTGRTWTAPHKQVHWTKEEDERLAQLLDDGLRHEDIAIAIGRQKLSVSMRSARLGLKSRRGSGGVLLPRSF
jgi:hypothetical protein